MDEETILRTCKPKNHDIDFEDSYRPPTRIKAPSITKEDKSMVHAMMVTEIAEKMSEVTDLIYIQPEDKFYYWNYNQKVWVQYGDTYLLKLFKNVAPKVVPNKKRLYSEVIFELKCNTATLPRDFEPDRNYLYFNNGALNLSTLSVEEKNKDHNIKISLDTDLDLKVEPPREFLKALKVALPDPFEWFDCLQALSSVFLVRHQRIEKAFFFLGSGGNGKSTIMKVLDNILGPYIAHVDMLDLQKDGFSKTALVDKLANSFSEISKMKQKDVGVFKAIASGDMQSVNSKFKDRFDSVIKLIQFYSSNQMPEIEEVNEGFIRRAHPIEFNQRILVKDPYIDDKLNTPDERKKILALLVKMAKATRKYGFIYEKTFKEKENILLNKTNPINEFLSSGIVIKREGLQIFKRELYSLYEKYCERNKFRPQNTIMFSKFLTSQGFSYAGRNDNPYWLNLGLKPVDEGQEKL